MSKANSVSPAQPVGSQMQPVATQVMYTSSVHPQPQQQGIQMQPMMAYPQPIIYVKSPKVIGDPEFGMEGITDNVKSFTETSDVALKKALLPNEVILGQFDCYFPGGVLPYWKIIWLCIVTCGFYVFVLLKRHIMRALYRMRCCDPAVVEFKKGKMAITSLGRIMCWDERVKQVQQKAGGMEKFICCITLGISRLVGFFSRLCCGDLCSNPVKYTVSSTLRIYSASSVREITQFYKSKAAAIWCCFDFDAGIEISINRFNYNNPHGYGLFSASRHSSFISGIVGILTSTVSKLEGSMGLTDGTQLNVICSNIEQLHKPCTTDEVLEELCFLKGEILKLLPMQKDSFLFNSGIVSKSKTEFPQTLKDITLVSNIVGQSNVKIPMKWVPLMQGEQILCVQGEIYVMKWRDWIKTICSFGLYYLFVLLQRKKERSALILTNKRIVELSIVHKLGEVPDSLHNVAVKSRSFFPGKVISGYISSKNKHHLSSSILCDGGHLRVSFFNGTDGIAFAKYMQMSSARLQMVPVTGNLVTSEIDPQDRERLPTLPGEQFIASFDSKKEWLPFCNSSSTCGDVFLKCVNACFQPERPISNFCSKDVMGQWLFPCLPWLCTCGLLPMRTSDDVLISAQSILRYKRIKNNGICGSKVCQSEGNYTITWNLLDDLIGQSLYVHTEGHETCFRRLFKNCSISKYCCPIGLSTYDLEFDVSHMSFAVHGHDFNHNFNKDPAIAKVIGTASMLQTLVDNKRRQIAMMTV